MLVAPAAGSLLVAALSGWTKQVHRHGRAVALAACGWGLAIVGFGFADALWLALAFLAVAGAMDAISGVFRSVMWNETIPDRLRGRLAGVEMISYTSGPTLGNFEAGAVASVVGVRASVVSGGVMCVAGTAVIVASCLPSGATTRGRPAPGRAPADSTSPRRRRERAARSCACACRGTCRPGERPGRRRRGSGRRRRRRPTPSWPCPSAGP